MMGPQHVHVHVHVACMHVHVRCMLWDLSASLTSSALVCWCC